MSSSLTIVVLLTLIVHTSPQFLLPTNSSNVAARFYRTFANLYRLAERISSADRCQYQYFFTKDEYVRISEESLTMLNTDVLERTIVYHSKPNFQLVGSRYFYRRDPKDDDPIEIELINVKDQIFREVLRPDRYIDRPLLRDLQYKDQVPLQPFYQIIFECKNSLIDNETSTTPVLSYIDRSFQWNARYLLDLVKFASENVSSISAYADLRNDGTQTIVIKAAELVSGDVSFNEKNVLFRRSSVGFTSSLGEQATGIYVYQLAIPNEIQLAANSLKSIPFLNANVRVESLLVYSSTFSPGNSNGKFQRIYNFSSIDVNLPEGQLILSENERFIAEIDLPQLAIGEVYSHRVGVDSDVIYRRKVNIVNSTDEASSITYYVEYLVENRKSSRNVRLDLTESFASHRHFQVKNISSSQVQMFGSDMRGVFTIKPKQNSLLFYYYVTIYKTRTIFD